MPQIYFPVGQTATKNFGSESRIVLTLPETIRPTLITTYAEQTGPYDGKITPYIDVLIELGNPRQIDAVVGSNLYQAVQANSESRQRNLELLRGKVNALKTDMPTRAQPFLDYAVNAEALNDEEAKVLKATLEANGLVLDLDELLDPVYIALGVNADATESHLKEVGNYIRTGPIDEDTLNFLVNTDPVFEKLKQYSDLEAELQEAEQTSNLTRKDVQQYLIQIVRAVKTGEPYELEIGGINVQPYLEELVGTTPGKQFLVPFGEVKQGKNSNGLLMPFFYDGANFPEEYASIFLHPQRFAQIIAALDLSLGRIMDAYVQVDEIWQKAHQEHELEVHSGFLVKAIMHENPAMQALYPDERVDILNMPELSQQLKSRTIESYHNGQLVRLAAQQLGIGEEELSVGLEKIIAVQNQIAPLFPLDFFISVAFSDKLKDLDDTLVEMGEQLKNIEEDLPKNQEEHDALKRRRYDLYIGANALLKRDKVHIKNLQDYFGMDPLTMQTINEETLKETISLFGEELAIIRELTQPWLKKESSQSK